MDDGEKVFVAQKKLLHVFLMIDGQSSREYQRNLILSLAIWEHLRSTNHPVWSMFSSNACAFNEEAGEICFSVLARGVAKNGTRSDIQKISKWFRLINTKVAIAHDVGEDICGQDFQHREKFSSQVDEKGEDVQATSAFFLRMIRNLKAGRHTHYDSTVGAVDDADGTRVMVKPVLLEDLSKNTRKSHQKAVEVLRRGLGQFWVMEHKDIWPASVPRTLTDSEDEEERPRPRGRPRLAGAPDQKSNPRKRPAADIRTQWMGRLLRIPSRELGDEWAIEQFGEHKSHHTFFHARIVKTGRDRSIVVCQFINSPETVETTIDDVPGWLVDVDDEGQAKDGLAD